MVLRQFYESTWARLDSWAATVARPSKRVAEDVTKGSHITYISLAGHPHDAIIQAVRLDGELDLAVDAGCEDRVQLTRIKPRGTNGKATGCYDADATTVAGSHDVEARRHQAVPE